MMDMDILYEDAWILAMHKPAGLTADREGVSCMGAVRQYLRARYPWKKRQDPVLLHRLDRPVSGVLLFALKREAARGLYGQFEKREVEKTYLALTRGSLPAWEGTLEHLLARNDSERKAEIVDAGHPDAKRCRLWYRVQGKSADGVTLLAVVPETGRYHQIRAQLAAVACPLLNDGRYGAALEQGMDPWRIGLHAHRLAITHPVLGGPLLLRAPLPSHPCWTGWPSGQ
ncbi:MAG: hypothetical protein RLY31_1708 [Bacteroidota bacterium]|jgi:23S rRNA-/tRNA-specific pseudouridylate synthase